MSDSTQSDSTRPDSTQSDSIQSDPISSARPPVLFIHGLWIHAAAWAAWQTFFEEHGYRTTAPGWPGDAATVQETRDHPEELNDIGIEAICHHYADLIDTMAARPVVVGHSFGGLIAQQLLAHDYAVAAVAIDPAPIKGVKVLPFSQLKSSWPVLSNLANKKKTVALTREQFRYSFGNTLSEDESDALYARWAIPGPGRPLFEDATANFVRRSPATIDLHRAERGPLLLMSGTQDHVVPQKATEAVHRLYAAGPSQTDYRVVDGRGHSLTIDAGWADVAQIAVNWIAANSAKIGSAATTTS